MAIAKKLIPNLYRDSVSLMQISAQLCTLAGVRQASAVMATDNNLSLLVEAGLLPEKPAAQPNDLLVVIEGDDGALQSALEAAESALNQAGPAGGQAGERRRTPPRSLEMGLAQMPDANLALISTPGEYAAAEALKALRLGLHVMLFSDNVSLEDEIRLKNYARQHGLIVMGPDCGTAILNGIPLAFANVVRRGDIGVVGASGTGLQQLTCLVDRRGAGISQAIGTGGRDLHARVGGISMLHGLDLLAADPHTRVIVLLSKPPAPQVAERILEQASRAGKPVVVNFLGAARDEGERPGVTAARTLDEAASMAVALANGSQPRPESPQLDSPLQAAVEAAARQLEPAQQYLRGLYSGGTFCYEATLLLSEALDQVYSNTPIDPPMRLENVWESRAHTLLDLGDEVFTRGRPHPMIDHRLRNERILKEAADPQVAVILLDVVLGYGSHPDPAGEMVPAIEEARRLATRAGRQLTFAGFVCGTPGDPQSLPRQEQVLRQAGVILAESNAQAVRLAAAIVDRMAAGAGDEIGR